MRSPAIRSIYVQRRATQDSAKQLAKGTEKEEQLNQSFPWSRGKVKVFSSLYSISEQSGNTKMFICVVFLVLQISFISAARPPTIIEQTFPSNVDYCCHCPNIELKCTFSGDPVRVFWSFPVNGVAVRVTDNTPGHMVVRSNGALLLKVNDTVYSRNNTYSCTALYSDEETVQGTPFVIPRDEDLNAPIHLDVVPMRNALNVQWEHEFPLCRDFTVYLNGSTVCTDVAALMSCTIRDLEAGVMYNVTVVANESFAHPIQDSKLVNTWDPMMNSYSAVSWLPLLTLLALVLALAIMC